jgi:hypothetical protein
MPKLTDQRRKDLKNKMMRVFSDELIGLPKEMRNILADDLVTAFENRLDALHKRKVDAQMQFLIANMERYEVLQT